MSYYPVAFCFFVKQTPENLHRTGIQWAEVAGLRNLVPASYRVTDYKNDSIQGDWVDDELVTDMYIEKYEDHYCIQFIFPRRTIQAYKLPPYHSQETVPFHEDPRLPIAYAFAETAESLGAHIAFYRDYLEKLVESGVQEDLQKEYFHSIKHKNLRAFVLESDWKILYLSGEWLQQKQAVEEFACDELYTQRGRLYFHEQDRWRF